MTTDVALLDYEKYAVPNWDGYDAQPITAETLAAARAIAKLLSQPADIAPCADGGIGFEWCDLVAGHKVFMDIDGDGSITIYARIGTKVLHSRKSKQ